MLIFILFCLVFSLLTIVNYIFSGFHSKNQRLLPMVMVVITLYYFYLLVEQLTGSSQIFVLLKDLLVVQIFSVLFYYVVELMELHIKRPIYVAISLLDMIMIIVICMQVQERVAYRRIVIFFLLFITMHLLMFVLIALTRKTFSRKQRKTYKCLLAAFLLPLIALVISVLQSVPDKYVMAPALLFTGGLLNYLLLSDSMIDARTLIKDELFASSGAPCVLFDADLYYLDASNSARELFPKMVEGLERNPKDYYKKDILLEWTTHYTDKHEMEIEGKFYNCIFQKVFLKGKPWGYILLYNDVTEQKNEANRAVEDAKNKSRYLAKMSHELRSPLHAIIGGSDIILNKKDASERTLVMIGQIRHAGEKLLSIVNSILEYSKMENGMLSLDNKAYEFYELLYDQAATALVNLHGKNVEFTLETHNPCPIHLQGDELRIREIIQNLLSNAVKFTENGHIKCDVFIEPKDDRKVLITIRVEDSGVGMSKEQVDKIFSEYVTYADKISAEGTGLGMAICKELCNLMGGDVVVESKENVGTTMTAGFMQEYCDLDDEGNRNATKDKPPFVIDKSMGPVSSIIDYNKVTPTYKYPKARVLVVDDLDVNQNIFFEMTRPWEFAIDKAYSGREAVSLFKENDYDLVVLDQMMPGMSGIETIDEIRKIEERGLRVPIVMVTADITDEMKALCKEHGFNSYLEKPISLLSLKEVLENNLPKRYRRPCLITDSSVFNRNGQVSQTVKESYLAECMEIMEVLPSLADTNLDLFRTKVHGLKSASRQLGENTMGEFSEVMEMAAKSGHVDFIKKHLNEYLDDIALVVEKVKQEMV